ncbi:MAG: ATP-dependent helicase HrpB [Bacteroidota bacterium]
MKEIKRTYPIDSVLPELLKAFKRTNNVVLSAPPGAGKTTRVPVALLASEWMEAKKLVMLEPRRLAARRAAEFMSAQLGESVGQTVGYRIRGETAISTNTRIEVVTEGILSRMLQHDSALPDVALVIFDEFHERSIHADLGLALTIDVQEHLRSDLHILVMSATLDGITVARLLGNAQIIESKGESFPVVTQYARYASDKPIEVRVAETVVRALEKQEGDVLVFLPGRREIRRMENLLWEKRLAEKVLVHSLYGDASYQQQAAALSPAPSGKRKVILSTSVAETSLTIDGVRTVIDSGLARTARFDVRRGMSGLVTIPVSKAVADQRRGRAGRQQPGVCYRLWTEAEHEMLPDYPQPEIKTADLAPFALDLAQWGAPTGEGLRFLDPPPAAHLSQAQMLLADIGGVDSLGKITTHGRAMAELPLHPRLSHMVLRGKELDLGKIACDIAALLEERDIFVGKEDIDIDLASRLHMLYETQTVDEGIRERILSQSKRLRRLAGIHSESKGSKEHAQGILLALVYPERIARRRENKGLRFQMANGMTAVLPRGSLLAREELIAIGEVDGLGAEVRIYLAAPVTKEDLREVFKDTIIEEDDIHWSPDDEAVIARHVLRYGTVVISAQHIRPQGEKVISEMIDGVRQMGLDCLPWSKDSHSIQERSEWLRNYIAHNDWPDLSNATLLETLETWLAPFLNDVWRRDQLHKISMVEILRSRFTHKQWQELERSAPSHLKLPSGSRVAIDYASGGQPVLAVKLQELFGQTETPRIVNGQVGIVLHLLSPASRPLAVTQDLRRFWQTVYPEIRVQMRSRYPRHFWPDNPLTAIPTNKPVKRKK